MYGGFHFHNTTRTLRSFLNVLSDYIDPTHDDAALLREYFEHCPFLSSVLACDHLDGIALGDFHDSARERLELGK